MRYQLRTEELQQPERAWAKMMVMIGWGIGLAAALVGLSPLWWGAPALLSALAWSLRRDAAVLRHSVCDGRVWVYEGRVIENRQGLLTLQHGEERVTLALTRGLALKPGMYCRLCLERGENYSTLLDLSTCAPVKKRCELGVCL